MTEDDTLEGYFEFIATAAIPIPRDLWDAPNNPFDSDMCKAYASDPLAQVPNGFDAGNDLMGSVHIFDAANMLLPTYAYNAAAIANFSASL